MYTVAVHSVSKTGDRKMAQDGGAVLTLVSNTPSESEEDPWKLTEHHRKLKSRGGDRSPRNISIVPLWRHRAWHALYQDLEPEDIDELFKQDYEVFSTDTLKSPLTVELHQKWSDQKIKRTKAWYALFADMTLHEIVEEINTVWLDPDYIIRIETIRVKVTRMVRTSCNLQDVARWRG